MNGTDPSEFILKILSKWNQEGVQIRKGVESREIDAFETDFRVRLSPTLRHYLTSVNGMATGSLDAESFAFWPLSEFNQHSPKNPTASTDAGDCEVKYFCFCDYLLSGAEFAMGTCARAHSHAVVRLEGVETPVAETFDRFLELYLSDWEALLG